MLDLISKDEGTWYNFSPENPKFGRICLHDFTIDEADRVYKRAKIKDRPQFQRGTGRRIDADGIDNKKAREELLDCQIVDWEGVSIDGEVVECTRENKIRAYGIIVFRNFVDEKLNELAESNAEIDEDRLKNSEIS